MFNIIELDGTYALIMRSCDLIPYACSTLAHDERDHSVLRCAAAASRLITISNGVVTRTVQRFNVTLLEHQLHAVKSIPTTDEIEWIFLHRIVSGIESIASTLQHAPVLYRNSMRRGVVRMDTEVVRLFCLMHLYWTVSCMRSTFQFLHICMLGVRSHCMGCS
jgi:hypothetical protein